MNTVQTVFSEVILFVNTVQMMFTKVNLFVNTVQMMFTKVNLFVNTVQMMFTKVNLFVNTVQMMFTKVTLFVNTVQMMYKCFMTSGSVYHCFMRHILNTLDTLKTRIGVFSSFCFDVYYYYDVLQALVHDLVFVGLKNITWSVYYMTGHSKQR